jgi:hypothetical protein
VLRSELFHVEIRSASLEVCIRWRRFARLSGRPFGRGPEPLLEIIGHARSNRMTLAACRHPDGAARQCPRLILDMSELASSATNQDTDHAEPASDDTKRSAQMYSFAAPDRVRSRSAHEPAYASVRESLRDHATREYWDTCMRDPRIHHALAWYEALHGPCTYEPTAEEPHVDDGKDVPQDAAVTAAMEAQVASSACFRDALAVTLSAHLQRDLRLTLDGEGTVQDVGFVGGAAGKDPLTCCMRQQFLGKRLPVRNTDVEAFTVRAVLPIPGTARGEEDRFASLPKAMIQRTMQSHLHEVRECYEHQLKSAPYIGGRTVVRFQIAPNGSVPNVLVLRTDVPEQVGCCIAARMRSWSFPEPAEGGSVHVTYPFSLVHEKPPAMGGQLGF